MNIKWKYVFLGLLLLLIVWIGNIFYYQKHILKEPIFLKHYFDVKQGMQSFRLFYIYNINPKDDVSFISFPEIGQEYTQTEIWDQNSDNCYYNFKTVNVQINNGLIGDIPEAIKNKVLTKARVHFVNGKTLDVNIGKIYLYSDSTDKRTLNSIISSGSSDYTGHTTFSCHSNLKIYGVNSNFPELMNDQLTLYINDVPLSDVKFPINVNIGDNITIGYKFRFNKEDINRNNAYEFSIDILTENETGEKGVNSMFVNYCLQSPEEFDITAMIRDRSDK